VVSWFVVRSSEMEKLHRTLKPSPLQLLSPRARVEGTLGICVQDRGDIRMMRDLVLKNRSYRGFHQEVTMQLETLRELVDLARLSASARNLQPLKYVLSCDAERNALIFPHIALTAYPRHIS